MDIQTKYSIGDVVYHGQTIVVRKRHPCPDCLGAGKWKAVSPAGGEYDFSCPRCSASYQSDRDLSLEYSAHEPVATRLTIGSVRVDTHPFSDDEPVRYMCVETGVGGGSVYRESRLFATQEDAIAYAKTVADIENAKPSGWIKKLYDKSLRLSDYQIENAMIEAARSTASRVRVDVSMLFDDLRDCETMDAVLDRIEEGFKPRDDVAPA